jgi:hypothetical protein
VPGCHGELRKVFSAAGLIFKGSGWHVKDYASPSRGKGGSSRPSGDRDGGSTRASPREPRRIVLVLLVVLGLVLVVVEVGGSTTPSSSEARSA